MLIKLSIFKLTVQILSSFNFEDIIKGSNALRSFTNLGGCLIEIAALERYSFSKVNMEFMQNPAVLMEVHIFFTFSVAHLIMTFAVALLGFFGLIATLIIFFAFLMRVPFKGVDAIGIHEHTVSK